MIDPLPPPVTHLSAEIVESPDVAVVTMIIKAAPVRALFGRTQIEWAAEFFAKLKAQMDEAARISAAS